MCENIPHSARNSTKSGRLLHLKFPRSYTIHIYTSRLQVSLYSCERNSSLCISRSSLSFTLGSFRNVSCKTQGTLCSRDETRSHYCLPFLLSLRAHFVHCNSRLIRMVLIVIAGVFIPTYFLNLSRNKAFQADQRSVCLLKIFNDSSRFSRRNRMP